MECQVDVTTMQIPDSEWDYTFKPNAYLSAIVLPSCA